MFPVEGALVDEALLDQGQVVERLHVQVLIICEDKHDVGLLAALDLWAQGMLVIVAEGSRQPQACCKGGS